MALKKSHLYKYIWEACNQIRNGMDASQYKNYILTLIFVKYVSDKAKYDPYYLLEVPEGGSFDDLIKIKGDKEIGDKMNKIIRKLAEANNLTDVLNVDFNDETKFGRGSAMQETLSNLIGIFENLDFSKNKAEGDDLLGDAYEYLMKNFAIESGKSKGEFYTPAEVSKVMAYLVGIDKSDHLDTPSVYDPTCGSGSLLIKAADISNNKKLAIYGQEREATTYAIARMNMIIHNYTTAEIALGNTLSDPFFKENNSLKLFDFALANPPFSQKNWANGLDPENDIYNRFEYGIPPAKNGDYAFLLHLLKSLKSKGKGAIILPHGVLFRGNKEAEIRKNLIKRGFIKAIVGLPPNLFYGTGIPACIIVLDKEDAAIRNGIFFIDASKGFIKDGNKNRLREQDIRKIVDVYRHQLEIPGYSRMVTLDEIEKNDYNLNIPRYIDSTEQDDVHNLHAHIFGGIPKDDIDKLHHYFQVLPGLYKTLFKSKNENDEFFDVIVPSHEIKTTIINHPDFKKFSDTILDKFHQWTKKIENNLYNISADTNPKTLIQILGDTILEQFENTNLVDKYDVYQILMDYWNEVMQDDVYLIKYEGWKNAAMPEVPEERKEFAIKETPDLVIGKAKYKMDLLPPDIIINKYFAAEKEQIENLQNEVEILQQKLNEFEEEHSTETADGEAPLLSEVMDEDGKISKKNVQARLKELSKNDIQEKEVLTQWMELYDEISKINKQIKQLQENLYKQVLTQYQALSEEEIKEMVINDKWMHSLEKNINDYIQKIATRLSTRIKELTERYETPLSDIEKEVKEYTQKVKEHLVKLGIEW